MSLVPKHDSRNRLAKLTIFVLLSQSNTALYYFCTIQLGQDCPLFSIFRLVGALCGGLPNQVPTLSAMMLTDRELLCLYIRGRILILLFKFSSIKTLSGRFTDIIQFNRPKIYAFLSVAWVECTILYDNIILSLSRAMHIMWSLWDLIPILNFPQAYFKKWIKLG